jgi:hypothetical protein
MEFLSDTDGLEYSVRRSPIGKWCFYEQILKAQQQADREKQRADRLAELLRAQGLDPDAIA